MNKRTIILIGVCIILAIVAVTMRYIEQEIKSIKDRFVGEEQRDDRYPRRPVAAPQTQPVKKLAEDASRTVSRESGKLPFAEGIQPQSNGTAVVGSAPRNHSVPVVRSVVTTTTSIGHNIMESAGNGAPGGQGAPAVEDVTTPLAPSEGPEKGDNVPVAAEPGGSDARDTGASGAEANNRTAAEPAATDASTETATAGRKAGEGEEPGIEAKNGNDEVAEAGETDAGQRDEITGETESSAVEGAGEDRETIAEGEASQEEEEPAEKAEEVTGEE